jgi:hypothetical protein
MRLSSLRNPVPPHSPARPSLSSKDIEKRWIRRLLNHLVENVGLGGMVGFRGSEVRSNIPHPRQKPSSNTEQDVLGTRAEIAA